jgi:transporter family protein
MNADTFSSWQVWALLSAVFAALTAIFAKIGVEDINSDLATLIRTVVVLFSLALILFATGQFNQTGPISTKSWIFLVLSGLGTGASWICYFRALKLGPATLVAPIDKLSVVLVALFGVVFLGERPSLNGWLGIVLIAAGAVLIAFKRLHSVFKRSGPGSREENASNKRILHGHQQRHADHDQNDARQFPRRQRLLERVIRHALREQHLHQRQRADIGSRRQRKGQEPELRGERAHEAREHRGFPESQDFPEHVGRAEQQIDRQHQRLHEQAEHQREGCRGHEGNA